MSYRKIPSWFVTEKGRKFSFMFATGAATGAFAVQYVPHTLLVNKYKDIVHLYRQGFSVPVPPFLIERFNKAVEIIQIPKDEVRLYKPFSVYGFDMFHAGSSFSRFGCYIGLPVNFSYKDVDSIDKQNIKILGESVHWDLPEANDFLDSVVLSEKAQLYAMAREMLMTQTPKLFWDCSIGTISVMVTYFSSRYLNITYNFYAKPVQLRLVLYSLVGVFATINYCLAKDMLQLHYERQVDEDLKSLGPTLVEGAREFYEKTLKRNIALRKLMGSEGKGMYSVLGNENYLVRQRHLPLVQRKSFFEEKLEENL